MSARMCVSSCSWKVLTWIWRQYSDSTGSSCTPDHTLHVKLINATRVPIGRAQQQCQQLSRAKAFSCSLCDLAAFLGKNVKFFWEIFQMMTTAASVNVRWQDGAGAVDVQCAVGDDGSIAEFDLGLMQMQRKHKDGQTDTHNTMIFLFWSKTAKGERLYNYFLTRRVLCDNILPTTDHCKEAFKAYLNRYFEQIRNELSKHKLSNTPTTIFLIVTKVS